MYAGLDHSSFAERTFPGFLNLLKFGTQDCNFGINDTVMALNHVGIRGPYKFPKNTL